MVLALSSASARRVGLDVLAATVIGVSSASVAAAENNDTAIRPFRANVPKADLADLRRRLAATRWPDKETVAGNRRAHSSPSSRSSSAMAARTTTGGKPKRS
jgi:hypothetical protein